MYSIYTLPFFVGIQSDIMAAQWHTHIDKRMEAYKHIHLLLGFVASAPRNSFFFLLLQTPSSSGHTSILLA